MTHVRVTLDHSERSSQDTYEPGQVQLKKNAQETILLCLYFFPRLLQIFSMTWEFAKITFCSQLSCGCNSINAK